MNASMMRMIPITFLLVCCAGSGDNRGLAVASASARERNAFRATFNGYEETPAINSNGSAELTLTLNRDGSISFVLNYRGLSGPATASHIHLGQRGVAGMVTIFFCGGARPACPGDSGSVTGTITAADVLAIPTQGLAAGDLTSVLRAMRAGKTYANIHTAQFPGGEIRGQIEPTSGHRDDDDGDHEGEQD